MLAYIMGMDTYALGLRKAIALMRTEGSMNLYKKI